MDTTLQLIGLISGIATLIGGVVTVAWKAFRVLNRLLELPEIVKGISESLSLSDKAEAETKKDFEDLRHRVGLLDRALRNSADWQKRHIETGGHLPNRVR